MPVFALPGIIAGAAAGVSAGAVGAAAGVASLAVGLGVGIDQGVKASKSKEEETEVRNLEKEKLQGEIDAQKKAAAGGPDTPQLPEGNTPQLSEAQVNQLNGKPPSNTPVTDDVASQIGAPAPAPANLAVGNPLDSLSYSDNSPGIPQGNPYPYQPQVGGGFGRIG